VGRGADGLAWARILTSPRALKLTITITITITIFLLLSFLLHSFLLGSFLLSSFLLTSRKHRIFLGFRVVVEQRCFSPRTSSDGCTTTYLFLVEASPVYMFVGSAHAHEARDKPAGTEAGQTDDAVLDNSTLAPPTGALVK